MTNAHPHTDGAARGPVGPGIALAFATVGYVSVLILGLGLVSLWTDAAIVEAPGLGQIPGIAGSTLSIIAFATTLGSIVRRRNPSFWSSVWVAAGALLAYLAGLWLAALFTGAGIGVATGVVGRIATTWFGVVIAGAALVAAWGGIALVRTRARRPRWPWEQDEE